MLRVLGDAVRHHSQTGDTSMHSDTYDDMNDYERTQDQWARNGIQSTPSGIIGTRGGK